MNLKEATAKGATTAGVGQLRASTIRRMVLEQSMRAKVGHIGSALCVAEILEVVYGKVLSIPAPDHPDRDRFILSKGHAALALYATLYLRGFISESDLESFCTDGSLLGVHPEHTLPGVDFSTGSLGHGLSFGAGAAMAARHQGSDRRAFVLMSDAEMNEGSVWEAIMLAAHHKLSNLIAIIDLNQQQAFGYTKDVIDLNPLGQRWSAFGWNVHEVDGHDTGELFSVLNGLNTTYGAPHVLLARTTFGKGVSFMENQIKWHYSPLSEDEYKAACAEVSLQS